MTLHEFEEKLQDYAANNRLIVRSGGKGIANLFRDESNALFKELVAAFRKESLRL